MKKKIKELTPQEMKKFCIKNFYTLGCDRCPFYNVICGSKDHFLDGREQEVEIDE